MLTGTAKTQRKIFDSCIVLNRRNIVWNLVESIKLTSNSRMKMYLYINSMLKAHILCKENVFLFFFNAKYYIQRLITNSIIIIDYSWFMMLYFIKYIYEADIHFLLNNSIESQRCRHFCFLHSLKNVNAIIIRVHV